MSPPIEIVGGRYRLLTLLGQGGMGSVWRGEHTSLHTPVAIKLLEPRIAKKESIRGRFLREARAAASLRSKHVVQILDHGVEGDHPYIVMELLRGESLGARLARPPSLPRKEIARIFVQMGRAVARAHKAGVVHRDLKPDNVFLAEEEPDTHGANTPGAHYTVKVVDFGIAKLTDDGVLTDDVSTDTGAMIGTPHYMSPEQARSVKDLDARADLWSMAIIAFECLTGTRPFKAESLGDLIFRICAESPETPSSVGPVPDGFDAWFARATQKKPADRFQDVIELVRALEDVLTPGSHQLEASADTATPPAEAADRTTELATTIAATPSDRVSSPTPVDPPAGVKEPSAGERLSSVSAPAEVGTKTGDPSSVSVAPNVPRSQRRLLLGGVAVVAVVGVAYAFGVGRTDSAPAQQASPASSTAIAFPASSSAPAAATSPSAVASVAVAPSATAPASTSDIVLTVHCTPERATVYRGPQRLGGCDEAIHVPWTDEPFDVSVRSAGHTSQSRRVKPAATVELTVRLEPDASKEVPF